MLEGFLFSGVTNFRVEQVITPKRLMSGLCLAVSFVCFLGLLAKIRYALTTYCAYGVCFSVIEGDG
jgi:hypothetical protein